MGQNIETGKIGWLPLTLYVGGYARYLLGVSGYRLEEGLVLVADDEMQARQFVYRYCDGMCNNGRIIHTWKIRRLYPENYEVGFFLLKNQSREDEVLDFLSEKNFFPVVVCGGILPEYLRKNKYIFRLRKRDLEEISQKEWWQENEVLYNFIIQNPLKLCEHFRRIERSNAVASYDGPYELEQLFCFFTGIAVTYAEYLKETETEACEMNFKANYVEEAECRLKQISEFSSGEDIVIRFSELVWEYLADHSEIVLIEGDKIESKDLEALNDERVILFNLDYYFFPPKLWLNICTPLLQSMSEPEVKKCLKNEGILYCNSADYTTKKTITTVYGEKLRPRFLWIYKRVLLSEDNLRLEDAFYKESQEGENYEVYR